MSDVLVNDFRTSPRNAPATTTHLLRSGICPTPTFRGVVCPIFRGDERKTDKQVEALWAGTYSTEFELVGNKIDQKIGCEPRFGPWFKDRVSMLHGFTHGGKEQLVRQASGSDIVSSFTGDEIHALVRETMPIAFLAALFTTEFLGYTAEYQKALVMFDGWVQTEASVQVLAK